MRPTIDEKGQRKMAVCPSYHYPNLVQPITAVIGYAEALRTSAVTDDVSSAVAQNT